MKQGMSSRVGHKTRNDRKLVAKMKLDLQRKTLVDNTEKVGKEQCNHNSYLCMIFSLA